MAAWFWNPRTREPENPTNLTYPTNPTNLTYPTNPTNLTYHRRMTRRLLVSVAALAAVVLPFSVLAQQAATPNELPRAIRRDVPMTNTIRRAFAAGTRDNTGRPGRNYWQLQTDYTINVRVDPATQTLTGSETIVLSNNSPDTLRQIYIRLDHNIFRPRVPFAASWIPGEITDGMVITKLKVNADTFDTATIPTNGRASAGAGKATASNLDRTLGVIALTEPIASKGKATLEIGWRVKLPAGPGSGHRMVQRLGDYLFQPTQWYPRIAKYDDLRGWDTNQYLGPSEFYNNFGRFDVSIDAPAGWLVSGTGVLQALFIGLGLLIVGIVWLVVMAMSAFIGWLGSTQI